MKKSIAKIIKVKNTKELLITLNKKIFSEVEKHTGNIPFITIDQEGGRVARITEGGTHFISQMALCATGDYNNGYLEGQSVAEELLSYGINMDFAPVLDVNNNPENPIIGIRSYAENRLEQAGRVYRQACYDYCKHSKRRRYRLYGRRLSLALRCY